MLLSDGLGEDGDADGDSDGADGAGVLTASGADGEGDDGKAGGSSPAAAVNDITMGSLSMEICAVGVPSGCLLYIGRCDLRYKGGQGG